MQNLPKRTQSQTTGTSAAELFSAKFTEFCNVIPVPQERDFGIDFMCELMYSESPTGHRFNVQCKGKKEVCVNPDSSDDIKINIKITTINYWFRQDHPTFLVVVDRKNFIFYWSFPEDFINSKKTQSWQNKKTISIPVKKTNFITKDSRKLPFDFEQIIHSYTPRKLKYNESFEISSSIIEDSPSREQMTIKELMRYYLDGCRIANITKVVYGSPGVEITVYAETLGGNGYSKELRARVWGIIEHEPAILLQLPAEKNYVLSHNTFKDLCFLLSADLSTCEVIVTHTFDGGYPGDQIWIKFQEKSFTAISWYEIPPGDLKLFHVNSQWYAISLVAGKTISTRRIEEKSGSYMNSDPRRDVIWHYFDLSGRNCLLPLKLGKAE